MCTRCRFDIVLREQHLPYWCTQMSCGETVSRCLAYASKEVVQFFLNFQMLRSIEIH